MIVRDRRIETVPEAASGRTGRSRRRRTSGHGHGRCGVQSPRADGSAPDERVHPPLRTGHRRRSCESQPHCEVGGTLGLRTAASRRSRIPVASRTGAGRDGGPVSEAGTVEAGRTRVHIRASAPSGSCEEAPCVSQTLVFVLAIVGAGVLTAIAIYAVALGRDTVAEPGEKPPPDRM